MDAQGESVIKIMTSSLSRTSTAIAGFPKRWNGGGTAGDHNADSLLISVHWDDEEVVVVLRGEFDLTGVEDFRRTILAIEHENIVLDVRDITFANSSAIAALLWSQRRVPASGGSMRIAGPWRPNVKRVLELTDVLEVLEAEDGG